MVSELKACRGSLSIAYAMNERITLCGVTNDKAHPPAASKHVHWVQSLVSGLFVDVWAYVNLLLLRVWVHEHWHCN